MSGFPGDRPPGPGPEDDEDRLELSALEVQVESRHFVRWKQILVVLLAVGMSLVASALLLEASPRIAIAGVSVIMICFLILIQPQIGFWLYYLVGFSRPQDMVWGLAELRISLAMAGVALLAWVFTTATNRRTWFLPYPQTGLLLGLCVVILASAAVHGGNWDRAIEVVKVIVVALGLSSYLDRRVWVRSGLIVMTLAVAWLTLWGLEQHFVAGVVEIRGPGIEGIAALADRNAYAMFIVMGLPLFYGLGMQARSVFLRIPLLTMVPLGIYAVLLTSSRGGLLGIAGVLGIIGWTSRHRYLATGAGMVGLALFYVFLAPAGIKGRAETIVNYEDEASAMGRVLSWQAGSRMAIANPILGVGPGNYVKAYHSYHSSHARQAHNTWVQAGAEYGLLGVFLLILIVIRTFRDLILVQKMLALDDPLHEWARMVALSLVGYMICGFFLSMEGFEPLYFLIAMTMVIRRIAERERDQNYALTA